uniref:Uncharacterized protein n=1 Tax=Timema monikensis TaxID=170555 RepID=A0A7R9HKR2_9NEOP|nr:unnamed protein product [Timema monikensis]
MIPCDRDHQPMPHDPLYRWLGCKWTVALSFIAYMPYIAAQFYSTFYTMIPAALFVGLGGGPLWCGKCTYLSVVADIYSKLTNIPTDTLTIRFFGVFFMIFQCSQIWGNLISSLVFSSDEADLAEDVGDHCGANFCPGTTSTANNSNLARPSDEKIYTVAGIYLGCMVLAVCIVSFGVDSLKSGTGLSGFQLLSVTLKLLKEPKQLLLMPIVMWLGVEQAFVGADYTAVRLSPQPFLTNLISAVGRLVAYCFSWEACGLLLQLGGLWLVASAGRLVACCFSWEACGLWLTASAGRLVVGLFLCECDEEDIRCGSQSYVSCAWGIRNIGYVMICYGITNSITAISTGSLVKLTGRVPIVTGAAALHVAIIVTLLCWKPSFQDRVVFFVMAGLWGVADECLAGADQWCVMVLSLPVSRFVIDWSGVDVWFLVPWERRGGLQQLPVVGVARIHSSVRLQLVLLHNTATENRRMVSRDLLGTTRGVVTSSLHGECEGYDINQ